MTPIERIEALEKRVSALEVTTLPSISSAGIAGQREAPKINAGDQTTNTVSTQDNPAIEQVLEANQNAE